MKSLEGVALAKSPCHRVSSFGGVKGSCNLSEISEATPTANPLRIWQWWFFSTHWYPRVNNMFKVFYIYIVYIYMYVYICVYIYVHILLIFPFNMGIFLLAWLLLVGRLGPKATELPTSSGLGFASWISEGESPVGSTLGFWKER